MIQKPDIISHKTIGNVLATVLISVEAFTPREEKLLYRNIEAEDTVPSRLTVYNIVEAMDMVKLALYRDTSVHLGTAHLSLT